MHMLSMLSTVELYIQKENLFSQELIPTEFSSTKIIVTVKFLIIIVLKSIVIYLFWSVFL